MSAPYEGRCSAGMCMRTGVVYIYYSKADGSGLNPEYVQVCQVAACVCRNTIVLLLVERLASCICSELKGIT